MLKLNSEGTSIFSISGGKHNGDLVTVGETPEGREAILLTEKEVMKPIPSVKMNDYDCTPAREIIYICGPSGSGKSTWCAMYISSFTKLFPKKRVYIFSRLTEDKAIDDLNVVRIPINDELVNSPINIHAECEEGCLFLFDDCDTIPDVAVRTAVMQLIKDILETGRHKNLYCLITSHLLTRRSPNENMTYFNELHRLVIFPRSGNKPAMSNILERYFSLEKPRIRKILANSSRWLCFGKNYPQYLCWDKGIQTL